MEIYIRGGFSVAYHDSGPDPDFHIWLYGYLTDMNSKPVPNVPVSMLIKTGKDVNHLSSKTENVASDANGYFEHDLGKIKGQQETVTATCSLGGGFTFAPGQDNLATGTFSK